LVICFSQVQEANAGAVTYSDGRPFSFAFGVPQWDSNAYPGYTLTSISIDFDVDITVSCSFYNFNSSPETLVYSASGLARVTLPNSQQLIASAPLQTTSIVLPPSGGGLLVSISLPASASLVYTSSTDFEEFIGDGYLSMDNSAIATGQGFGPGIVASALQDQISGGANLSVRYEWAAVPEPSTALLGIIGLFVVCFVARSSRHRRSRC
jgi:hypothetical protein